MNDADPAQSVIGLASAFGGGAVALEIVRWALGKGRANAESRKLSAEADAAIDLALNERIRQIMSADKNTIARHEATIERMHWEHRAEIARLWNYVTTLRNMMHGAGMEVPLPPACDVKPSQTADEDNSEGDK